MDIEDPNLHIKPGAVLFYLTFKVLGTSTLASQSLVFDDAVLFNAAWKSDGTEFSVQHVPDAVQRSEKEALSTLQASIRPNPTSGETTLAIKADSKGKARLALFDAFGKRMFIRDLELTGAMQEFLLPETTPLPTGVYFWKVAGKDLSAKGHLVKQ